MKKKRLFFALKFFFSRPLPRETTSARAPQSLPAAWLATPAFYAIYMRNKESETTVFLKTKYRQQNKVVSLLFFFFFSSSSFLLLLHLFSSQRHPPLAIQPAKNS